jgi:squalene-hopene/tetraprenyl-beta-curcumene cyclase
LAGLVEWKEIPQLPFELAALPMSWFRFVKMNVVSYAIPALVAIGQVRFHFFQEKRRFIGNFVRRLVRKRTLRLIEKMQPESGGYLEAAPLTSFVVMSLSAMGLTDHPIVTKGLRFLLNSIREDGGVPIDTNLATWVTTLSVNALGKESFTAEESERLVDWILSCQHTQKHPFTGAAPGGWGWTDLSGAVPDADDTAGAMLALLGLMLNIHDKDKRLQNILQALYDGGFWLRRLQNNDGGIPTFCRGWGMLPFDKSSTDLTAHAMRVWVGAFMEDKFLKRAVRFLERSQQGYKDWKGRTGAVVSTAARGEVIELTPPFQPSEGSWLPLWFGNQHQPDDANPFYGTAKVLLALITPWVRNCFPPYPFAIVRGYDFLIKNQNPDGSWGGVQGKGSIEETAVVVEALAVYGIQLNGFADRGWAAYHRGLDWIVEAVESDRFLEASPIGLYFAKLWYYEELYPIIFTAAALRRALLTI